MSTYVREAFYDAMADAEPELLRSLVKTCQKNPWLKTGGVGFDDGLYCEHDYGWHLSRFVDPLMLRDFFEHGNWAIRAAVTYQDLIFVNQVNGGDEWLTIKIVGDQLIPFESITFGPSIERGEFSALLERLHVATLDECRKLTY